MRNWLSRSAFIATFVLEIMCLSSSLDAHGQRLGYKLVPYSDSLTDKAQAGDTDSQVALGVAYLQGDGVARRYDQAFLWLQKAYMAGSSDAAGWLGGMYLAGQGMPSDIAKGSSLIEQSRVDGSAVGVRYTALMAEDGVGQKVDMRRAFQLYELAAVHRDPVSCDRMGLAYQAGRLKAIDMTKAFEYYRCGAEQGYSWSHLHLGELYASNLEFSDTERGTVKGTEAWPAEAYEEYSKSANSGNRVGAFRAGECLRDGKGVAANVQAAAVEFGASSRQLYGPAEEALADLSQAHPELGRTKATDLALYEDAADHGQTSARTKANVLVKQMASSEISDANRRLAQMKSEQQAYQFNEQRNLTPANSAP